MFEITVRGITRQFETAQEMNAWRERMSGPQFINKRRKQKRKHDLNRPNSLIQSIQKLKEKE